MSVLVLCLRVLPLLSTHWIDLPELISIQMGGSAFSFKEDDSTTLIMRSDEMKEN